MKSSVKNWSLCQIIRSTGIFTLLLVALFSMQSCSKEETSPLETPAYTSLNSAMRKLWSDHASWTREVIVNFATNAPGLNESINRLLKNQEDIGNAIKPYYGNVAGDALTTLLKEHITTAAEILTAAKAGNTAAQNDAAARWYANGDQIATFLSTANPKNWPLDHMKSHMKDHLDLTLEEAVAELTGNYTASVAAYDKIYPQLLHLADLLSEGVALQFPDKFK